MSTVQKVYTFGQDSEEILTKSIQSIVEDTNPEEFFKTPSGRSFEFYRAFGMDLLKEDETIWIGSVEDFEEFCPAIRDFVASRCPCGTVPTRIQERALDREALICENPGCVLNLQVGVLRSDDDLVIQLWNDLVNAAEKHFGN